MKVDDKLLRKLEAKVLAYRFREKDADDRKTYDEVFDQDTLLTIYDMMSSGILDTLDFPIATGKEGNVFRATTKDGDYIAVKIYRISNSTFNNIQKYITGDERFRKVGKSRRKTIFQWAQKEFRNLERMRAKGIRVPEPIKCLKNVIAMEFIGPDGSPAPQMKDVELGDPQVLYDHFYTQLKDIYQKAGLVHADFSEYNVLMCDNEPVIIDVGQAVLNNHPMALEFLKRDLVNLNRFFKKSGITGDVEQMMNDIVGDK